MTTVVRNEFVWTTGPAGRTMQLPSLGVLAPHVFTSRDVVFRGTNEHDDYRRLASCFGVEASDLVGVRQVHGRSVETVRPDHPRADRAEADAIISTDPSAVIMVRVADCVPILLADRRQRAVAAVHAGWRGTCAGIATTVVEALADMGIPGQDLVAAIGPSIGPCCYQVDERVRTTFLGTTPEAVGWFAEDGTGRWKLDLWAATVDQLEWAGVPTGAIHCSRFCTADHLDRCFSYRAEGPGTGRLVAAIRLIRT